MSFSIEGTIRRPNTTPKWCLDEWLFYSWAFFYWQLAQTNERRSACFTGELAREGCNLGLFNVIVYFTLQSDCQTNTLICTHPVHCDVYRGAPREHERLPVNMFHLLFFSPVPRLLSISFLLFLFFIGRPRVSPQLLARLFLRVLFLTSFIFIERRWVGGTRSRTCRMKTILDRSMEDLR